MDNSGFNPVELTGVVEIIGDNGSGASFARSFGLQTIIQNKDNAFAANRLLLPLQNEVFRAFGNSFTVAQINEASQSPLLPFGAFSLSFLAI